MVCNWEKLLHSSYWFSKVKRDDYFVNYNPSSNCLLVWMILSCQTERENTQGMIEMQTLSVVQHMCDSKWHLDWIYYPPWYNQSIDCHFGGKVCVYCGCRYVKRKTAKFRDDMQGLVLVKCKTHIQGSIVHVVEKP